MSRPGISKTAVKEAIKSLQKQGYDDPGVHLIRQHLGQGGTDRISRLKREIKQELGATYDEQPTSLPLPHRITSLAEQLWTELQEAAERMRHEYKGEINAPLTRLQERLDLEQKIFDELELLYQQQAHELAQSRRETQDYRDQLAQQQQQRQGLEQNLAVQQRDLLHSQQRLEDAVNASHLSEQQHVDLRQKITVLENRLTEEQRQHEEQVSQLREFLADAQRDEDELRGQLARIQWMVEETEQKLKTAAQTHEEREKSLQQQLGIANQQQSSLLDSLENLQATLKQQQTLLAQLQQDNERLRLQCEK